MSDQPSPIFKAKILAGALSLDLLVADDAMHTTAERGEALVKAFARWPSICRAMAALEELHPLHAENGAAQAAKLLAFLERQGMVPS